MQHWHTPDRPPLAALALTHGAGSNCDGPLLRAIAERFCSAGVLVLRYDLAFRELGKPPGPATGARDRESIRTAVAQLRGAASVPVFAGGHSYGGRQTSMAAAEDPALVAGLLLMSYPLHPPGRPAQLRTDHFPALRVPTLFFHGARDTFGTEAEMRTALAAIPVEPSLEMVESAGHELARPKAMPALAERIVKSFLIRFSAIIGNAAVL